MTIIYGPASPSDADEISRIARLAFNASEEDDWNRDIALSQIENYEVRILMDDYTYLGFAIYHQNHIASIAIDPHHRGKGHGRTLLLHVLEELLARKEITIEAKASNKRAINLYLSCGFAPYYSDSWTIKMLRLRILQATPA